MNPRETRDGRGDSVPAQLDLRRLIRLPSAFVPVVISLAAMALVAGHVLFVGSAREADEGAAAHLWQLLMVGQIPFVLVFAVKWIPRSPPPALIILAVQLAAAAGALAPVFFLGL